MDFFDKGVKKKFHREDADSESSDGGDVEEDGEGRESSKESKPISKPSDKNTRDIVKIMYPNALCRFYWQAKPWRREGA